MDYKDKTMLITGSTDGLGKSVAHHLAHQGAKVLLHGRNQSKGEAVKDEIQSDSQNPDIYYYNADFSSLKEVQQMSETIKNNHTSIDILLNNAGIGAGSKNDNNRKLSKDGIELRLAVNYVAHVLLTEKLLNNISMKDSRILNVSSIGQSPINFNDIMLENHYDGFLAYEQSKAAQIMYTFDLAERLNDKSIYINALHPASLMNTNMVIEWFGHAMTTVEEGKEAVLHVLSENRTGNYYNGKKIAKAISQAYDTEARKKLKDQTWDMISKYL